MHGQHVHPDDFERVAAVLSEAIASDAPEWRTVTCACLTKSGSYEEVTSHFTTRRHRFIYSISTRGHLEGAAVDLRHLLTSTSFDLRCCATNIIGAATLLRGRASVGDDDEGSFLADAVITSCGMLNGLAANVLQVRALERNEVDVTPALFSVSGMVKSVVSMCTMAKSASAHLDWNSSEWGGTPGNDCVIGDAVLVSLCLQNLATNALKFSSGNDVDVVVALEAGSAGTQVLRIDVADRGIGIAPEMQERVFQKFVRTSADKGGGSGLGLALARGMARAMGGDITLRSTLGEGSTFTLRVPVKVGASGEEPADVPSPATKKLRASPSRETAQQAPMLTKTSSPEEDPFDALPLEELVTELLQHTEDVFLCATPTHHESGILRISYVSPSIIRALGWLPEQLVGQVVLCLVHPADLEKHITAAGCQLRDGDAQSFGLRRLCHADGTYRWMHVQAIRHENEKLFSIIWRDATRVMASQCALQDHLLGLSHDLRTPISGILAAAQLLEKRERVTSDAEALFLVDTVRQQAGMMLSVVQNVLDLRGVLCIGGCPRVSSDSPLVGQPPEVPPTVCIFHPLRLIRDTLEACAGAMGHQHQHVLVTGQETVPACAEGDLATFTRLIQNCFTVFFRHAVDARQLHVHLGCIPVPEGAGTAPNVPLLTVDWADPCRHVPPQCIPILFHEDAEKHTPQYVDPSAGGVATCLAKSLAFTYARDMGGDLFAEAMQPGCEPCGIVIRLRLPLRVLPGDGGAPAEDAAAMEIISASAAESPSSSPATPAPVGVIPQKQCQKTVLLIEDHALNLILVSKLLRSAGLLVETASNGAEALSMLRAMTSLPDAIISGASRRRPQGCRSPQPDLVLTAASLFPDIHMPVMDGLEFARQFRASKFDSQFGRTLLIALTANVQAESITECLAAGFDSHFSKPLRPDALKTLRNLMDGKTLI